MNAPSSAVATLIPSCANVAGTAMDRNCAATAASLTKTEVRRVHSKKLTKASGTLAAAPSNKSV
eukprot:scaffold118082_cov34-Tisochrysis_lutea.AAC.1